MLFHTTLYLHKLFPLRGMFLCYNPEMDWFLKPGFKSSVKPSLLCPEQRKSFPIWAIVYLTRTSITALINLFWVYDWLPLGRERFLRTDTELTNLRISVAWCLPSYKVGGVNSCWIYILTKKLSQTAFLPMHWNVIMGIYNWSLPTMIS